MLFFDQISSFKKKWRCRNFGEPCIEVNIFNVQFFMNFNGQENNSIGAVNFVYMVQFLEFLTMFCSSGKHVGLLFNQRKRY